MRLDLETEIRYMEGDRAGVLRRVMLDESNEVSEVVMATDDFISRNVIVPVHLLEEGPGGVLNIKIGPDELDTLHDYSEQLVPAAPDGWEPSDDAAPGGDVFPATMYQPLMPVVEMANIPEGQIALSQGTEVLCLDGPWGIVDEVALDDNGALQAFVARPNSLEEHDRIVPSALISEIGPDGVLLNCTLSDLPTYTQELVGELEEPEVE